MWVGVGWGVGKVVVGCGYGWYGCSSASEPVVGV